LIAAAFTVVNLLFVSATTSIRDRERTYRVVCRHVFFSVQTMATIGYGKWNRSRCFSNILVAIEALTGLLALR